MTTEGRKESFRSLYVATRPLLLAYALRRTTSIDDAADVVAETYTIAWRRFDDIYAGEGGLLWLYATARRVIANERRRAHRRGDLLGLLVGEIESSTSRSPGPEEGDAMFALAALAQLSDDDRELLMLVAWEGLDSVQLGCVLDCSPTAARIRLHRARARLTSKLSELGVWVKHRDPIRHSLPDGLVPTEESREV